MRTLLLIFLCSIFFSVSRSQEVNDTTVVATERVGRRFSVTLEGNSTTGYEWMVCSTFGDGLKWTEQYKPFSNRNGLMGVGGLYVFNFKASRAGDYRVVLEYKRSWESAAIDRREYLFTVKN